jgi:hypothetical protein
MVLPWYGGVAAVWSVCLLFFQAVLLLGYLYAHFLARDFRPGLRSKLHLLLLGLSLLLLPILPKESWKPSPAASPMLHVLLVLAATVGLPFLLLSSTSPLLQAWYSQMLSGSRPYRFYALSNAGSMLGLLSYPLLEPVLPSTRLAVIWSLAYAVVAFLCGAILFFSRAESEGRQRFSSVPHADWRMRMLWIALPACASALLLGITNHISQNIASIPFLWVIPLSLYLLSFVLCFADHSWYRRGIFLRLLGVALGGMAYALSPDVANLPLKVLIPLFCTGLFTANWLPSSRIPST